MLRELMEWAALLKLASHAPGKLLIRDGLLTERCLALRIGCLGGCVRKFEKLTTETRLICIRVWRRKTVPRVMSYLSIALARRRRILWR